MPKWRAFADLFFAKNAGQKVYLNGANFWPIWEFSGLEREPRGIIRSLDEWYLTDGIEKEDLKELYLQEIKRNQIRKYPEAFGRVVKGNARTVPMKFKV